MAIFIPPLVWAGAAGVAVAGFVGKKVYDYCKKKDSESPTPAKIIFLTGELGVGKDTIYHILKDGNFGTWDSSTKIEKYIFDIFDSKLCVINTAGARHNDDENIEARKDLPCGTNYIYVFNASDYFTKAEIKEQVQMDLEAHKDMCSKNHWNLKIIGTHLDKCYNIERAEIDKLINEIGEKGKFKCQILDLTQFTNNEKQRNLYDLIVNEG